jgi:hypothetical protein
MKEETGLALCIIILILTIGGCGMFSTYTDGEIRCEREKTKQMEIQARADSLKIVHQIIK